MNLRTRVAAVLVGAVLMLASCTGKSAVDQSAGGQFRFVGATSKGTLIVAANRKKAGSVSGSLLDGGTFRLSQTTGKVVVLNFWATWCAPCVVETPQFDSVYRAYKGKGVTFVGIDTKEASRDSPKAFVKNNDISFPIVFDEQGEVATALGKIAAPGLPFSVLLDRLGRVAAVYLGTVSAQDLEPVLNKLVAES
jgi:thiol-disulfide isomerase/thioredoxin